MVTIQHVRDFDAWFEAFEDSRQRLAARGMTRHWVYRAVDSDEEVMLAMELPSREHAEQIMRDRAGLRSWLERSGLDIYPSVFVGDSVQDLPTTFPGVREDHATRAVGDIASVDAAPEGPSASSDSAAHGPHGPSRTLRGAVPQRPA